MDLIVKKSALKGRTSVPPSKSQTMRALLFSLMASGESVVKNYLHSPDTEAMINAIGVLGAKVKRSPHEIIIKGTGGVLIPKSDRIEVGNSGQVFRFIGALCALQPAPMVLSGDWSITHNRPITPLLEGIAAMGGKIDSTAPVTVRGTMAGGEARIHGIDSQPVSGLIMALSFAKGPSVLNVTEPGELPWIDLTLSWLDRFHIPYRNENYHRYTLPGGASISGFNYTVPADYSSLAFPIAAALVTNSFLVIEHIDLNDCQGDKQLVYTLQKMGAHIEIDPVSRTITVHPGSVLTGGKIDLNGMIDAVCILSVLGCFCTDKLTLFNGAIARNKESNRLEAMATNLRAMNGKVEVTEDGLVIYPSVLKGARVDGFSDHRVAMSSVIAALAAEGESHIHNVECIAKSYPSFCEDLRYLGAEITIL